MSVLFQGETLRFSRENSGFEIALHRAPCNEIGDTTLTELERVAAILVDGVGDARSLLIHSEIAGGFSAGADLRALYEGIQERKSRGITIGEASKEVSRFLDRIHNVFDTFDMLPITTIGALHGVVFGGGFELALTCDVLVADKSTRFCFPELRLGLIPGFGGIPRLSRDLGNAVVRDLLLTGRSLNATRAHDVGLVSQLVPRGEALRAARGVATQAARFDAATTRTAKAFMKALPKEALEREKDLFCRLFLSPVVEEALRKFVTSTDARPYLP